MAPRSGEGLPKRQRFRPIGRALGVVIVAALAWHAVTKLPDHLPEMLWVCHIASLVMAIGLFTGRQVLVAGPFLMHLGWGAPTYALDAIAAGSTTPSSVVVHALPLLAGALAVAANGWPRRVVLPAWVGFAFSLPVAYVLTPPALNVNLAHAPWPPLAALLPQLWMSWAFNAGASLILMAAHAAWLRRWRPRADEGRRPADPLPLLGAVALLLLAFHFADHLRRGELGDLLWLSNAATLVLAVGCALRWPSLVAVAALWLCASAVLWTADVLVAGSPIDSAILTHLGSLAVAVLAVRALGMPARSWRWATGGLALLVAVARLATPAARNVNLAFSVSPGWEGRFVSHGLYLALLLALAAAIFFVAEWAAARTRGLDARRLMDYATIPAFLTFTVVATIALAGTGAPYALTSGLVIGVVAAAAAIIERLRPEREEHRALDQPLRVEALHFVCSYMLGYGLAFAACAPIGRAMAILMPVSPWPVRWPVALQIVLAALLAEGVSYWQHRLSHRVPLLWRFHALHHSGARMNLARTARFHFADIGPGAFLVFLPLVALRAPESIVNWAATLSGVFGVLQHSNIRMRTPAWLDRLVCTPAVHRLHHSRDGRESNANFGTLVMVFDRLFGSYRLPDAPIPVRLGIEDDPVPRGFVGQMFGPFRPPRRGT